MHLKEHPAAAAFAEWLLDVGHGQNTNNNGNVQIPPYMECACEDDLVDFVYPGLHARNATPPSEYFLNCLILSTRNHDVESINSDVLQ